MSKGKGRYTILLIPDHHGKTFSVKVHKNLLFFLIVGMVLFFLSLGTLMFGAGEIATRLQQVSSLKKENEHLKDRNRKLAKSLEQVEKIEQLTKYLRRLALTTGEDAADLALQKGTKKPEENVFVKDSIDNAIEQMRFVKQEGLAAESQGALPENYAASLPSIRPLDGWITQRFSAGADTVSQHGGIDFAASRGSPIMATAPGVVSDVELDRKSVV
jgi:murein DD-endopeptidase MepM/ murein hydrolase activator NlpD